MRTHIELSSPEFPPYPEEGEQVNPGRYGKRLAEYLRTALSARGFQVEGIEAEDWGWMVIVKNEAFPLWVGCGNYEEFENGFLCFIEPSKPTIRKWFKKIDTTSTVEKLAGALEEAFSNAPGVSRLRWWSENED